jgi:antitoxin component YwqK of YwqJK toxin-antitoxin module
MKRSIAFVLLGFLLAGCVDVRKENYPNGKLKSEAEYRNGRMFGTKKIYYESGELQFEGTYEYDVPLGQHTYYYKNGKPLQQIQYIDGKLDGVRRLYDESGKLKLSASYTVGNMNDDCTEFSGPKATKAVTCDFESALAALK